MREKIPRPMNTVMAVVKVDNTCSHKKLNGCKAQGNAVQPSRDDCDNATHFRHGDSRPPFHTPRETRSTLFKKHKTARQSFSAVHQQCTSHTDCRSKDFQPVKFAKNATTTG